ncbi:hypothetical protein WA026_014790 [Henosepilachna vigintioctopunctata]|uniref:Malectin domain-containing protein n=1 Tax=Henosepilachna vigintioctopunctata TaxID=420089 RepID=A0AAW1V2A4_9CUCU
MILRIKISIGEIVECILLCLVLSVRDVIHGEILGSVIYAVNCGGDAHIDVHGIRYERDPLHDKIGIASDYGKRLLIGRVPPEDHILYQTERYHTSTFGYDIPITSDGDYVLVLKFSEVYFNAPNQKVFDVILNSEHTVVADLDIFEKVGRGYAHDEYVPFTITKGHLIYNEEESIVRGGKVRVEFIKGNRDNPKINAIYAIKGKLEDVPKLPLIQMEPEKVEEAKDEPEVIPKNRRPSPSKLPDPYTMDDSALMLPVFFAIGAFIPILFCLCKL